MHVRTQCFGGCPHQFRNELAQVLEVVSWCWVLWEGLLADKHCHKVSGCKQITLCNNQKMLWRFKHPTINLSFWSWKGLVLFDPGRQRWHKRDLPWQFGSLQCSMCHWRGKVEVLLALHFVSMVPPPPKRTGQACKERLGSLAWYLCDTRGKGARRDFANRKSL